jgi:hypothetical protein
VGLEQADVMAGVRLVVALGVPHDLDLAGVHVGDGEERRVAEMVERFRGRAPVVLGGYADLHDDLRFGRSLGINNIPPKICSYSCVYCQVGRTDRLRASRGSFHGPEAILADVRQKVDAARSQEEPVDYLTFVPDGEPTLDLDLGRTIRCGVWASRSP